MTAASLLVDFNKAIDLAIIDAWAGNPRWLRELAAMGEARASSYPKQRRGFRAAAARAREFLPA